MLLEDELIAYAQFQVFIADSLNQEKAEHRQRPNGFPHIEYSCFKAHSKEFVLVATSFKIVHSFFSSSYYDYKHWANHRRHR
jgi:hypothetical protein